MNASETRDTIADVRALLAAASTVPDVSLRIIYVAQARARFDAEVKRAEETRLLLDAAETELARLARG